MVYQLNQQDLNDISHNPLHLVKILQVQTGYNQEDFKIQAGRKTIWGRMASGEFRRELNDPNYVDRLLLGLEKVVNNQTAQVEGFRKIPEFQISIGDRIFFRQEVDGSISVNELQIEKEKHLEIPSRQFTWKDAFSSAFDPIREEEEEIEFDVSPTIAPEESTSHLESSATPDIKGVEEDTEPNPSELLIAKADREKNEPDSSGLLKAAIALNQEYEEKLEAAPPNAEIKQYIVQEISAASEILFIEEFSQIRAIKYNTEMETLRVEFSPGNQYDFANVSPQIWDELQKAENPENYVNTKIKSSYLATEVIPFPTPQIDEFSQTKLHLIKTAATEAFVHGIRPSSITYIDTDILKQLPANPEVALKEGTAFNVLHRVLEQWNPSAEETQKLVSNLANQAREQFDTTKQLVERIALRVGSLWEKGKSFKQQIQTALSSQEVQESIQVLKDQTSSGLVNVGNWIATRPDAIATYRLMQEAFAKFNQGHDRTLENRYRIGDFQIDKQGQHLFTLSQGDRLVMSFTVQKNLLGEEVFHLKDIVKDFVPATALKLIRNKDLEVTGSLEAMERFQLLKQQMLDKLLQLEDGTYQLKQNYTLNKHEEIYELKNAAKQILNPENLTLAEVKTLSQSIDLAYREQQVRLCAPILAKHLQLQGTFHEETDKRIVTFDSKEQILSYQNKHNPNEYLKARWLGDGQWRYQAGELTQQKERELLEVVAPMQQAFESQELPMQRQKQPNIQKQQLEI